MDMKAFLMQNLSLVAVQVFEIYVTKFSSEKGNESSNSGYLPPENGLSF